MNPFVQIVFGALASALIGYLIGVLVTTRKFSDRLIVMETLRESDSASLASVSRRIDNIDRTLTEWSRSIGNTVFTPHSDLARN